MTLFDGSFFCNRVIVFRVSGELLTPTVHVTDLPLYYLTVFTMTTLPVSRAQVTGRAEFTCEQLRMREINTVNIRC